MLDRIVDLFNNKKDLNVDDFDISQIENGHHYSLSSILPYLSWEENIFYNRSSVGFVLETIPFNGVDERMEKELANMIDHILPAGSNLQIMLYADNKTSNITNQWVHNRSHGLEVITESAIRRKNFFESESNERNIRDFRLFISYSQSLKGDLEVIELEKIKNILKQIENIFISLNVPTRIFSAVDLINLVDTLLNMNSSFEPTDLKWNRFESLSNQMISPNTYTEVEKDGIYQQEKEKIIRTYNVRGYPSAWSINSTLELLGEDVLQLSSSFLIHVPIHIVKDSTIKTKLFAKALRLEDQANSPMAKWVPSLGRELEEWRSIRKEFDQDCKIVNTSYNIVLFSNTKNIDVEEQKLQSLYRSKGWNIIPNTYTHLPILLSTLPMSWGERAYKDLSTYKKTKTTISKEVLNLLPVVGEWKGTQTPGMLFVGRKGQIFNWHNFDNDAGNYNVCVVGRSGSGKSVFMQEMVSSTIGMGGRVFIIDVGRSFEKTTTLYDGKFIEFNLRKPICINPFSNLTEDLDQEEIENSLSMLKGIVSLMAAPTSGTSDVENSLIEQAIKEAYNQYKNKATIDNVIENLQKEDDVRAKTLAKQLYSYSSEGVYSKFFSGDADITFKENLITIEFEELRQKKDLRNVVLQTVILQITNQMILGKRSDKPFNIVIDEAWDMLKGGNSGEFVETLARTLRKFNGSLVVGTQSVNDFYSSPAAQAAFDNSDWLCLLSQKKESIAALKESNRLVMDDHMEKMLKSVNTRHGQYAEVMIYGTSGFTIGRLVLDPFSQMLYSTKAEDYRSVLELRDKGLSLKEAINHLIESKKEKQGE